MRAILEYLLKRKETISFAESMTGGALAASFIKNSNASLSLKESFVVYSNEAKQKYLNIDPKLIEMYDVVSSEVCEAMVRNLHLLTNRTLCIATTGYAERKNPNLCYFGMYYQGEVYIQKLVFEDQKSREENIDTTVSYIVEFIKKTLKI
ncbi:nicotinamide-nucleotide amidohydrolase family protein [Acholeplasma equirhinis]|uniref:CinA family protein n=1 Tax=Acholeplasma equirhinis TaxID=555393 RepID=UPI00197B01EE|nr:nicotinamide-nucleotide amidohydrolase family protein [Acholeplasma equirhinis]MBN3490861.1 nicotinamide-nucleotide amidohydrolase family protein [Acholeplasma equirhinis]